MSALSARPRTARPRHGSAHAAGQVLAIMPILFITLLAMTALVVDGGRTLVLHRQAQDAGDAVALAAANVIPQPTGANTVFGCRAAAGSTTPRPAVVTAAATQLAAVAPWIPANSMTVTCPILTTAADNFTVEVAIGPLDSGPGFRGILGIFGPDPVLAVSTISRAVHGTTIRGPAAVVVLDPHGCQAVDFNGNAMHLEFSGGLYVDSDCGSAANPCGPSGSLTGGTCYALTSTPDGCNHSTLDISGGVFVSGTQLGLNPSPSCANVTTGVPPLGDPLDLGQLSSGIEAALPSWPGFDNGSNAPVCMDLTAGIYASGINPPTQTKVLLLHPGIYKVLGDFTIQGSQAVMSVSNATTCADPAVAAWANANNPPPPTWLLSQYCPQASCGAMLYVVADANNQGVNINGSLILRGYNHLADPRFGSYTSTGQQAATLYDNLVIWQNPTTAPPAIAPTQSDLQLRANGTFQVAGTIYAPWTLAKLNGNPGGGSGNGDGMGLTCIDLPASCSTRFVVYRLRIDGNVRFTFPSFVDLPVVSRDYGLVK